MKNDYSAGLARFRAQLAITRRALAAIMQRLDSYAPHSSVHA